MIQVTNLVKDYGTLRAVDNVSFSVQSGEIIGLLGPNGAGKTTIMKVLTGYHYQSAGKAILNGFDVAEDPIEAKKSIGYLPETAPLYTDMTVKEYLDFIANSRLLSGEAKKNAIDNVVDECGLACVYNRIIDTLSKGYRQRVGLAQAILHSPEILILDEPTTGLDPNQILEIRNLIKKIGKQKTVILSTHIMQEVEAVCDRVIIINQGRVAAEGTTQSIAKQLAGAEIEIQAEFKNDKGDLNEVRLKKELAEFLPSKEIHASSLENHRIAVSLKVEDQTDIEEKIFDFAVSHGYKLLALASKKLNLEEIFIKLTNSTASRIKENQQ